MSGRFFKPPPASLLQTFFLPAGSLLPSGRQPSSFRQADFFLSIGHILQTQAASVQTQVASIQTQAASLRTQPASELCIRFPGTLYQVPRNFPSILFELPLRSEERKVWAQGGLESDGLLDVAPEVVDHALLLLVDDDSEAGADDDAEADAVEDVLPFGLVVGTMEHDVAEGH